MNKKGMFKAVISLVVALTFVIPSATSYTDNEEVEGVNSMGKVAQMSDYTCNTKLKEENIYPLNGKEKPMFGLPKLQHPPNNGILRLGDTVEILGSASGSGFLNYVIKWGAGKYPPEWFTDGIDLVNGGTEPVDDGKLADWNTTFLPAKGYYSLRLTVNYVGGSSDSVYARNIYADPTFKKGWPVKLESESGSFGVGLFQPLVVDLNNDSLSEIVVYKAGSPGPPKLYVFDCDGKILPNYPVIPELDGGDDGYLPFPIAGDINNDGYNELVVFRPKNGMGNLNNPPCVMIYNYDGDLLDRFPVCYGPPEYPEFYPRDFCKGRQELTMADLNNDGNLEIIILGECSVTILNNQGNTLDGWPKKIYGWICGSHIGSPAVGNLDSDNDLEIVIAEDWAEVPNEPDFDRSGMVYAFNLDGTELWRNNTKGYSFSSPSIGDINNDGRNEIIVGFKYWEGSGYGIYVFDDEGNVLDGWPQLEGADIWSNPVIGDFDNDQQLEIVVSTICQPGLTYMFEPDGSIVDGWPQTMPWIDWYSPVIADVSGDGVPDVITNNNLIYGTDSIYAWEYDGSLIPGFPKATGASVGPPVVVSDIDNDGLLELIATSGERETGDEQKEGTIYVWELNKPLSKPTMHWPMFQHDLHHSGLYTDPEFKPEPLIAYASGPYEGIIGSAIEFSGSATGGVIPYTWYWDFGDGNTSEDQNPTHFYNEVGVYNVTLVVTDSVGTSDDDETTATTVYGIELGEITGGFGVNFVIKNKGGIEAMDVEWSIAFEGGTIIFPLGGIKSGTIDIPADGEETINTMVFGFGFLRPVDITVTVADTEKSVTARVILFFVLI